jgi:hypothetical protein
LTDLLDEIIARLNPMSPEARDQAISFARRQTAHLCWVPNPGPQTLAYESEADELFYGGQAGGGKLQSMDSKVLTPFGWVEIGSLKVGSKLCAFDGTVTEVIGVFPQGVVDLFRVTMSDGGSTEAGLEHNWLAWPTHVSRKIGNKPTSGPASAAKYTTAEIMAAMQGDLRRHDSHPVRFAIPLCHPVAFNVAGGLVGKGNFVARPIDPYLLGVLLGDGSFRTTKRITVTSADEEILQAIRLVAGDDVTVDVYPKKASAARFKGPFLIRIAKALADLKLLGHYSHGKFIPRQYLFAPVEARWALLQGLMDTDGWAEPKRGCHYCTASSQLAKDVTHLARSLGAVVSTRERLPTYTHKGERRKGLRAHDLRIKVPDPVKLFRLERKRAVAAEIEHQSVARFIEKIEFSRRAEAVCIQVRHRSSLYITDDFIVTHNTDLGLALTQHRRSLILRRVNKDALKLAERVAEILGHRTGYNGQLHRWKLDERLIEFAGCEHEEDKQRFKGDPHDLIYFDEGTDFLHSQYRFIVGWNRSVDPQQRCRIVVGSNPPTTAEGLWVIKHWAPWLDPVHPRPAAPGELRWFTTAADGEDVEVDGRGPHLVRGEPVAARSRSYIPARLDDNPDLRRTGYAAVLAGLPEELRRAYRDGNFSAALKDDDFQVIPTAWIEAAQARWRADAGRGIAMTAIGLDVAQGGADKTVPAARHGGWYAPLLRKPGHETRDGSAVAAAVVAMRRGRCPVVVDVGGGWGGDTVARLKDNGILVVGFNGAHASLAKTRDRQLAFVNKRAEAWWRMREELDPGQDGGSALALPPDASIKADLAAPRWQLTPRGIKIEDKDEIRKRLGRSPDEGDAIVMCLSEGARAAAAELRRTTARPERANVGYSDLKPNPARR